MSETSPRKIAIIGGGIIGCTSAYYLACHPSSSASKPSIAVFEASSIAGGASGKAGGLIAKWAYPKELVDVSFNEHLRLAKEHGGAERWGWRVLECGEWVGRGDSSPSRGDGNQSVHDRKLLGSNISSSGNGLPGDLDWINEGITTSYTPMSTPGGGETMQVHPYQFTNAMAELAKEKGVKIIRGRVTSIIYSDGGAAVKGVRYINSNSQEETMETTDVLIAAGPWSSSNGILPALPMNYVRAHSITIRTSRTVAPYALFTSIRRTSGKSKPSEVTPEIYARPNNEVYVCYGGDAPPLPLTTADVLVDENQCDALFEQASSISSDLASGTVTAKQACYLPSLNGGPRGCPMIGAVNEKKGLYIATGHTCWGICNAPGTAKAISELILDGKVSWNLDKLAPSMFV